MRLIILSSIALTACVPTDLVGNSDPVISAFNGSTVTVQAWGINPNQGPGAEDVALAKTACKNASYLSTRKVSDSKVEFLFKC